MNYFCLCLINIEYFIQKLHSVPLSKTDQLTVYMLQSDGLHVTV